jgi:RNA polymerase sigma factor (sigma-70 family)
MENAYSYARAPARLKLPGVLPRSSLPRSDAELVAAADRDPDAFTQVFQRHWDSLVRFCVDRAGSPGEDIAAETFRVAFDRRSRYDERYPDARPWLFGIATNLLRDHFRATRREERKLQRSAAVDHVARCDPELDVLERRHLDPAVVQALEGMPAAERDALLLLAWGELDYDAIAQALEVPIGTVRSRIHRARRRLREHLPAIELIPAETEDA